MSVMSHITWMLPAALAAAALLLHATLRTVRSVRDYAASRTRRPGGWPASHMALGAALIALAVLITVPAFVVIYITVTTLLDPYMGIWSWTVPVCGEIAFAFLFGNGILLALRRAPGGGLRAALMAGLMAGSVILNVYAARRVVPSAVGHVVVVVAFFGVMLAGKATVMTLRGGKVRADRITPGEWIAQPARSLALWRWMKTWGEPSRDAALDRYMRLLFAISVAQADERVGRDRGWRKSLPLPLRYELATGQFPQGIRDAGDGWQEAVTAHVTGQLMVLGTGQPESIPGGTAEGSPEGIGQGTGEGTAEGSTGGTQQGSAQGSGWPESRTVDRAVLLRRTKAAMKRYEDRNGKALPATQLGAQLRLRMSRDTATKLIAEASAPSLSLAKPAVR
jgi:hypothetical protein